MKKIISHRPGNTGLLNRELSLRLYWYDFAWIFSIGVMFIVCIEMFYRMLVNYNERYPSDFPYYATYITTKAGETHDRFIETLSQFLYNINHNTLEFNIYAAFIMAAIIVANYAVVQYYLKHDGVLDAVPRYAAQIVSIMVFFTGPIFFPHFHEWYHRGSFASFAWHSPTQQTMMLFSLIATICLLKMFHDSENGISARWWIATAVMTFMSAYTKPSFVFDLVPGVILLFLLELFSGEREEMGKRFRRLFIMGCSLIPAGLYILLLQALEFGDTTLNGGAHHIRFGIEVFREKNNVMSMFVFGMAFAIVVFAANYKRFRESKYFLTFMLFFWGVMQWALLAETGYRAKHGNFGWGKEYGCYFLNLICLTILLENIYVPDSVFPGSRRARKIYLIIAFIVLAASVLSQLKYFMLILTGKGYWQ